MGRFPQHPNLIRLRNRRSGDFQQLEAITPAQLRQVHRKAGGGRQAAHGLFRRAENLRLETENRAEFESADAQPIPVMVPKQSLAAAYVDREG